ncbi:hypothetical protein QC761_501550 [Podospora bellae-mahoneyi]|uniref:Uncharacterized protein n=1 Tax=Podospora bellae-mahoneyi TaxID=2093777 RepID=A0ABR0FM78_9PEZI|nr:hypothetical protein QC761_501550 [Podospora bellae-mahoneyi]
MSEVASPVSLTTLSTELRHKVLASVIWTSTVTLYNHLDLFFQDPRVRLRDDWDIWVPTTPPQPPALSLLLTCRILRYDVQYLLNLSTAQSHPYEIDVVFIAKCGLFPTWVCCPLPSQINLDTLQASFRIMDVEDIDDEVPAGRQGEFLSRYRGVSSDFDADNYPTPPPGSWNFYRLLASFLALGPRGLTSPAYQRENRGCLSRSRYSLQHLIISVTSKEETEMDDERRERASGPRRFLLDHNSDLPYGASREDDVFPGPPDNSPYTWTGPTKLETVRGMYGHAGRLTLGHADRYGLYLANTLWALLNFKWLSRGFGLMVYESILDGITFYVDGKPRPHFGMDDLLSLEPIKHRTLTPEVAAALQVWKEWVMKWRSKLRERGMLDEPRPSFAFVRYLPASMADPNECPESDSNSMSGSDV